MSYSNNWKISGVAGLTSLKNCYKSNGDPILQRVGCPRQNTSHTMIDTPEHIITDDGPIKSHTDFRYYVIPNYQINNKNIGAYGHTNLNKQQTDANYIYGRDVKYKDSDHEYDSAIKWNYDYIPLVMFDNLTQMNDSDVSVAQNNANGAIRMTVNNETLLCLIPSTFYSLYKIEEQLTITSSDIHVSTQLYTPFTTNYSSTYDYCLGYNTTYGTLSKESFSFTRYCDIGFFVKYEYIFKTDLPQLSYNLYYGNNIDTSTWKNNLFSWNNKKSVYSIGRGDNSTYTSELNFKWGGNFWNNGQWTTRNDGFEYMPHWDNGMKNFLYLYEGSGTESDIVRIKHSWNGRGYSKNWRYLEPGTNNYFAHGFIVTQDIFIIAPSYKWLFSAPDEIYKYNGTSFNEIGEINGASVKETKILEARQFNYSGSQTSVKNPSTYTYTVASLGGYADRIRTTYYEENIANNYFAFNYGTKGFEKSSYINESVPIATGFYDYSSVLDIPFPYDNTSNSSILDIKISDFIQSSTLYTKSKDNSNKWLKWSGTPFCGFYDEYNKYRYGVAYPSSTNTGLLYINFYNHHLMLDPSIHLAAKSSKRNRFAWVAFMTEPIWLEYANGAGQYALRHKFNNLDAEQPLVVDIAIDFNGDIRTVRVDFSKSYYNIQRDIQERALPNGEMIYVGLNYINVKNSSGNFIGFETGYASIAGINWWHSPISIESGQYLYEPYYNIEVDDGPYTNAYKISGNATKIKCTITRESGEVISIKKDLTITPSDPVVVLDAYSEHVGSYYYSYTVFCFVDTANNQLWIYGREDDSDGPSDWETEFTVQFSDLQII